MRLDGAAGHEQLREQPARHRPGADAIAAVVIGGTLLTGGSGYVVGTVLGVLVYGVIQTIISFQGTLSSWWTRIVIGGLLFVFIVLQRAIASRRSPGSAQQVHR